MTPQRGLESVSDTHAKGDQKGVAGFAYRMFAALRNSIQFVLKIASRFEIHEGPLRAASLAYYGVFSIFPLILFLIYIGSAFLTSGEALSLVLTYVENVAPTSTALVERVIEQTVQNRRSIGLIGIVGLLWGAATLFAYLEASLNVIWDGTRRAAFRRRLIGVITVLIIGLVFILSILLSALPALTFLGVFDSYLSSINLSLSYAVTVLFFWLVYRWLPNARVMTVPSLIAAVFAGLAWKLTQSVFQWFLTSGLVDYGALYGSLASIIAFILWVYLNGYIILLGAEFGSTLQAEVWGNNKDEANSVLRGRSKGEQSGGELERT